MAYDKSAQKTKQAKALIEKAARDVIERNQRRGIQKTLRAMVVGVPNVGKSTFINRLYGGGITKTGDRPGRNQKQPMGKGFAVSGGAGYARHALA